MSERDWLRMRSGPGGFISGIAAVIWGLKRILRDAGMKKLAALPVALTSVFYAGMLAIVVYYSGDLLSWAWDKPEEGFLRLLWYLLIPFVVLAILLPLALLFMTIAEMIGGPFYDRLAMQILDAHGIRGKSPGFIHGTVPDLFRSLMFTLVAAFCGLLALIPALGLPFGVFGAIVAWIGFASAAINPVLMATGYDLSGRLGYTFKRFFTMAGIGAVVWLSLFVPFIGLIAIPSAVVGASEMFARSER